MHTQCVVETDTHGNLPRSGTKPKGLYANNKANSVPKLKTQEIQLVAKKKWQKRQGVTGKRQQRINRRGDKAAKVLPPLSAAIP
jgi:hypothetical protein